jgi:hypothetical protein
MLCFQLASSPLWRILKNKKGIDKVNLSVEVLNLFFGTL